MAEHIAGGRPTAKRRFFRLLGPGLIAGASDDDPSGIATYSQMGAQFGFAMSWTMLFTFPLMAAIQEISARIGRRTGRGIAANIRRHHSPALLYGLVVLMLIANTINLGADLGAMADALRLLISGPRLIYVIAFGVLCAGLEILVTYGRYAGYLRWSTLVLFAYVAAAFITLGIGLNFAPLDPVRALFWAAVVNGVVAGPVMAVTMVMARQPRVMGKFKVPLPLTVVGWIATATMAAVVAAMAVAALGDRG